MTEDATPKPVLEALCAFVRNGTISMVINDKDAPATDIGVTCRFVQNQEISMDSQLAAHSIAPLDAWFSRWFCQRSRHGLWATWTGWFVTEPSAHFAMYHKRSDAVGEVSGRCVGSGVG
jgi:hypothetical protein